MKLHKFEVGKDYERRDFKLSKVLSVHRIIRRTDKSIWVEINGQPVRATVEIHEPVIQNSVIRGGKEYAYLSPEKLGNTLLESNMLWSDFPAKQRKEPK